MLRCPECSAEIDVDEDEVEEGEILSCPECETELEVSQTHPVALNPISDELEEDDEDDDVEEEEDEEDFDEDGDLPWMKTKMRKRKTRTNSTRRGEQRHPRTSARPSEYRGQFRSKHRRMRRIILALVASLLCYSGSLIAQESSTPATTPNTQDSSKPSPPDQGSSSSKTRSKAIPSFLILGTVFNENAISFPDVQVRIRRTGEKKFRWDAYTNSRGEFAVRVPPGLRVRSGDPREEIRG